MPFVSIRLQYLSRTTEFREYATFIDRQSMTVLVQTLEESFRTELERREPSCLGQVLNISQISDTFSDVGPALKLCCAPYRSHLWLYRKCSQPRNLSCTAVPCITSGKKLVDSLTAAAHKPKYSTDIPSVPHTPAWALVKTLQAKETLTLR